MNFGIKMLPKFIKIEEFDTAYNQTRYLYDPEPLKPVQKFSKINFYINLITQLNQPTRCNNFSNLLLDVYVQLNMFRAFSRPSSGAQQLQ